MIDPSPPPTIKPPLSYPILLYPILIFLFIPFLFLRGLSRNPRKFRLICIFYLSVSLTAFTTIKSIYIFIQYRQEEEELEEEEEGEKKPCSVK